MFGPSVVSHAQHTIFARSPPLGTPGPLLPVGSLSAPRSLLGLSRLLNVAIHIHVAIQIIGNLYLDLVNTTPRASAFWTRLGCAAMKRRCVRFVFLPVLRIMPPLTCGVLLEK